MKATLYLEYYIPRVDRQVREDRHNEILQAIQYNLRYPVVDKVVVFAEETIAFDSFDAVEIEVIPDQSMTYQAVFDYANARTGPRDIHILANNDIALMRGFERLDQWLTIEDFFALSRYEPDSRLIRHAYGSQDTWIWRGPSRVTDAHYYMGVRGCDCKLIGDARRARYVVSNPCLDLFTMHWHQSEYRPKDYQDKYVQGPWFGIEPSHFGEVGELSQFSPNGDWKILQQLGIWGIRDLRQSLKSVFG